MRPPRLLARRRFRPLVRVLVSPAATCRLGQFRPLALVLRRTRTRVPPAPAPTLVANDGVHVTIAPRLQWHLHLHQHLHHDDHRHRHQHRDLQVVPLTQRLSPARARPLSVLISRVSGLDYRRRAQSVPAIRLTVSAPQTSGGIERSVGASVPPRPHRSGLRSPPPPITSTGRIDDQDRNLQVVMRPRSAVWSGAAGPSPLVAGPSPLVAGPSPLVAGAPAPRRFSRGRALIRAPFGSDGQPASELRHLRAGLAAGRMRRMPAAGSTTTEAVERPRRAAATRPPVPVTTHLRAFARSSGPGPHLDRGGTSRPTRRSPDPDRGRAVPPPVLTSLSGFAAVANRAADRARPLLDLRWPWTGGPGTSSLRIRGLWASSRAGGSGMWSRVGGPGTSSRIGAPWALSRAGGPGIATIVPAPAPRWRAPERSVFPASITFRRTADAHTDRPAQPLERVASAPPPPVRVDIDRISDEVIRRMERRSRVERERRGLL